MRLQAQQAHHHQLVFGHIARSGFRCNECGSGIPVGAPTCSCRPCNYDACWRCFLRTGGCISLPTAYKHEHPLTNTRREEFFCNICRCDFSGSSFYCSRCDWDECARWYVCATPRAACRPMLSTTRRACSFAQTDSLASESAVPLDSDVDYHTGAGTRAIPPRHPGAHEHALRYTTDHVAGWWCCGLCARTQPRPGSISYWCSQCDYDECPSCFVGESLSRLSLPSTHAHPHPLRKTTRAYSGGFICNLCRCSYDAGVVAYHCDADKYDECEACFLKTQSREHAHADSDASHGTGSAASGGGGGAVPTPAFGLFSLLGLPVGPGPTVTGGPATGGGDGDDGSSNLTYVSGDDVIDDGADDADDGDDDDEDATGSEGDFESEDESEDGAQEVDEDELTAMLPGSAGGTLVYFFALWCVHCRPLLPIYDLVADAARRSRSRVLVLKINGDDASSVTRTYGVTGFPTILWFARRSARSPIKYTGERTQAAITAFLARMSRSTSSGGGGPSAALVPSRPAPSYSNGLALLFYNGEDLRVAGKKDVTALRHALSELSSYNIRTHGRGTWEIHSYHARHMMRTVRHVLAHLLAPYDTIIVLFTGHGCIPSDDVQYTDGVCLEESGSVGVPMKSIMTAVNDSDAFDDVGKHKVYIYDACSSLGRVHGCSLPPLPPAERSVKAVGNMHRVRASGIGRYAYTAGMSYTIAFSRCLRDTIKSGGSTDLNHVHMATVRALQDCVAGGACKPTVPDYATFGASSPLYM